MARIAGGQRAVEDRVAQPECADDMVGPADPQRVLRRRGWQRLCDPAQRLGQEGAVGPERPAAEAVSVEADVGQIARAFAPQALDPATLHYREDARHIGVPSLGDLSVELLAAAARPAHRALNAALLFGLGRLSIGAVVEADHDVRSELELNADHSLGRQVPSFAGRRLTEDDLVVADHAALRILPDEAPDLESARVAEHRTGPVHEPMDTTRRLDHPRAWTAQQVKRVDDQALDTHGAQVGARDAADARASGIRQEGGHRQRRPARGEGLSHRPARSRTPARSEPM